MFAHRRLGPADKTTLSSMGTDGFSQNWPTQAKTGLEWATGESPGTDHEWQTWRRDLKDFAPRLF